MFITIQIICYIPNATFIYNPVTSSGTLTATFIAKSDSSTYQVCQDLDGHLAQAQVELANSQEASSANFNFRVGEAVEITIPFKTAEQQKAALITTQSNFKIKMLDMDAEVKQTLSYFSVLAFNNNDCFGNMSAMIKPGKIIVSGIENGCDLNSTQVIDNPAAPDIDEKVIFEIGALGQQLGIYGGNQFMAIESGKLFEITFDCELQTQDKATCYSIIQSIIEAPLFDLVFQMKVLLSDPADEYIVLQTPIEIIQDEDYIDCFSDTTFQINSVLAIFYFQPINNCVMPEGSSVQIMVGFTDNPDLQKGTQWTYLMDADFSLSSTKISIECKGIPDDPTCIPKLTFLQNQQELKANFKILITSDGLTQFIYLNMKRYQNCFATVDIKVSLKLGAKEGSIQLTNTPLTLQNCKLEVLSRQFLEIKFYERTVSDGYLTQIVPEPFFTLTVRENFNKQNTTVLFEDLQDISTLHRLSILTIREKLYCTVQYSDILIPVINYTDDTATYDQTIIYVITIVSGILGGLIYATVEVLFGEFGIYRSFKKQL